jgi:hypothetical protein
VDWEHRLGVFNLNIFEVTARLEKQDLSNIRAHDEFAAINPGVANKVGRNRGILIVFPAESAVIALELVGITQVVVLVDILTRHNDDILIRVAERNLAHDLRGSCNDLLSCKALLLVPLPNDDFAIIAKSDKHFLILLAEVNRYERLGSVVGGAEHTFLLDVCVVNDDLFVGFLVSEELKHLRDIVNGDDGCLSHLTNCKVLAVMAECHGGYAFGTFDAGDEFLCLVFHRVDHNVVTTRVTHHLVV